MGENGVPMFVPRVKKTSWAAKFKSLPYSAHQSCV
jgi:hypothetical protein